MIRLDCSKVALTPPLDAASVRDRLMWVTRARALVADSLEQSRAGPRFELYLNLPSQSQLPTR